MLLTQPTTWTKCEHCDYFDSSLVHFCNATAEIVIPKCYYCWGPTEVNKKRNGWQEYCSPECKRLDSRPRDAKPSTKTLNLVRMVASR